MNRAPDSILIGGRVLTFDDASSVCEAIALTEDRIAAVGTDRDVVALAGPQTNVIQLRGRTVIPGIVDAHAHMEREGLKALRLSLAGLRSVREILERIGMEAMRRPKGEWIVTMPVGEPPYFFDGPGTLVERRMPDRHELDRAAPDHPVCISGVFGNWGRPPGYTALNTLALQLNSIGRDTKPACEGVTIERDASGEPTGIIVERNNRPTVEFDLLRAVPKFSAADRLAALRVSMRTYNAVGTTSIYEGHGSSPETIACYRQLAEEGALTVRTALTVSPTWSDMAEAERDMRDWLPYARGRGFGDEWLRVCGLFIGFGDDPAVAKITRAALPDTGWTGFVESANSPDEYRAYARLAAHHDLRVHTIVGDRLAEILPILEDVDRTHPLARRRWVLEHVGRIRAQDIAVLKRLGIGITTIPVYQLWKNADRYLGDADAGESAVPHRMLLDAGIPLAAGTDNIPYNPFFTVWAMAARTERTSGRVIGPGQRLAAGEGLRLLTRNGPWFSFEEARKGTLEAGKLGDLAVLSDDPRDVPVDEIASISAVLTMAGGRVVHHVPWE
ncbi:MAG TPA: amidohydrolase [Casimicrobiaceae bacterium]|nr:amidohydrolase [Casimicrobiaceae bacterium]